MKRGRPKKDPELREDHGYRIRLTKREKETLSKAAKHNNMTIDMLIRTGLASIGVDFREKS